DDWFRKANIDNLMRHARFDVDEVARFVLDDVAQARAVLMTHAALEDVEHDLKIDVDMGIGHATGRNGGDVHRQLLRADVLCREAGLVLDAVPSTAVAAAAD